MTRATVAVWVMVAASSLAACARTSQVSAGCGSVPADIVAAAGVPVYGACDVDTRVGVGRALPPVEFMPTQRRVGCFAVIFEFVVDSTGMAIPGTEHRVSSSDQNMERAVLDQILATQYVPATKGGRRVAQLVQVRKGSTVKRWFRNYDGTYTPEFDSFVPC
jgi:hypothetical protein